MQLHERALFEARLLRLSEQLQAKAAKELKTHFKRLDIERKRLTREMRFQRMNLQKQEYLIQLQLQQIRTRYKDGWED